MPQMDDGHEKVLMPPMSTVALGNLLPDPKAVEAIREATEKRHKAAPHKADPNAWMRSKNKAYRRKMARQHEGGIPTQFLHERKKGR